jgi:acyl carrier protein
MKDSIHQRLVQCFATVFPEAQAIPDATPDTEARWDSASHILLVQVIEDEFGISIPEATAGELLSFRDLEAYVAPKIPSA